MCSTQVYGQRMQCSPQGESRTVDDLGDLVHEDHRCAHEDLVPSRHRTQERVSQTLSNTVFARSPMSQCQHSQTTAEVPTKPRSTGKAKCLLVN